MRMMSSFDRVQEVRVYPPFDGGLRGGGIDQGEELSPISERVARVNPPRPPSFLLHISLRDCFRYVRCSRYTNFRKVELNLKRSVVVRNSPPSWKFLLELEFCPKK